MRLSDQEENCSAPLESLRRWSWFWWRCTSTAENTESSQCLLKYTENKNTHTLCDCALKPRDFTLLILLGYYFLGEVIPTCAVKPASKNLAAILFPLVMHKNLQKDSGDSIMTVSCYHKHLGSKILGQDCFVKQTELKSHSPLKSFVVPCLHGYPGWPASLFPLSGAEGLSRCWKKTNTVMPVFELMNLKSAWLCYQQLQAFCAFSLNLRWLKDG